ncbi:hypothetical protein Tco_0073942 [Tanacetum coccineum]
MIARRGTKSGEERFYKKFTYNWASLVGIAFASTHLDNYINGLMRMYLLPLDDGMSINSMPQIVFNQLMGIFVIGGQKNPEIEELFSCV